MNRRKQKKSLRAEVHYLRTKLVPSLRRYRKSELTRLRLQRNLLTILVLGMLSWDIGDFWDSLVPLAGKAQER